MINSIKKEKAKKTICGILGGLALSGLTMFVSYEVGRWKGIDQGIEQERARVVQAIDYRLQQYKPDEREYDGKAWDLQATKGFVQSGESAIYLSDR
ncbi:hypothetical protein AYK26_01240 [Euryarchaeota archaeon SM23-78]|nr:MAG: hypothetical protein AYK26_01240 [Euryarchaeota archaeon SM23-78]MBW3000643.1 hypothetical protein [Candidatus Woesearchaeota archaeon]